MPASLTREHRTLEAERNGQADLAVRASRHQRLAMAQRVVEQACFERAQITIGDFRHAFQRQAGPGVGDVLHGRAEVHPLARLRRQHPLQFANQAQRRMAGLVVATPDIVEAELPDVGIARDLVGGGLWNEPEARLILRQRRQHLQPRLRARHVVEDAAHLLCTPRRAINQRIGDTDRHRFRFLSTRIAQLRPSAARAVASSGPLRGPPGTSAPLRRAEGCRPTARARGHHHRRSQLQTSSIC